MLGRSDGHGDGACLRRDRDRLERAYESLGAARLGCVLHGLADHEAAEEDGKENRGSHDPPQRRASPPATGRVAVAAALPLRRGRLDASIVRHGT